MEVKMQKAKERLFLALLGCLVSLGVISIWPTQIGAQFNPSPSPRPTAVTTLQTTIPAPHFSAGEEVIIDQPVAGDLYIAGGMVRIKSRVAGDVLAVGGSVIIDGEVQQDVRAAGGMVEINGQVYQNVTAAGGTVLINKSGVVQGHLIATGGRVLVDGTIGGNQWLSAGTVMLNGRVGGQTKLQAEVVKVGPTAVLAGAVTGETEEPLTVAEGAQLQQAPTVTQRVEDNDTVEGSTAAGVLIGASLLSLVMGMIATAFFVAIFPSASERVAEQFATQPMVSLVWGSVYLFVTPFIAVLLMVTVIGLPLGSIFLLGYILSLFFGNWVAALGLGRKIARWSGHQGLIRSSWWQLLAGFGVLLVLNLITVIGWLLRALLWLVGLGALVITFQKVLLTRQNAAGVVPVQVTSKPVASHKSAPAKKRFRKR
jgi:cytoskeletal protein CcmA (bactofilin family)